jgi:hypothetical protein
MQDCVEYNPYAPETCDEAEPTLIRDESVNVALGVGTSGDDA